MKPLRIMIAALDWGLGHATRCVPIIDYLRDRQHEVILASSGRALKFWQRTYPDLECLELPAYSVTYTSENKQLFHLVTQFPRLFKVIRAEHQMLGDFMLQTPLDAIISDNRYGLWHPQANTVFICHQLAPVLPGIFSTLRPWLYRYHRSWLARFQECWIPDTADKPGLSGSLSHGWKLPEPSHFIGPLSRFYHHKRPGDFTNPGLRGKIPEVLAVISGPEPQRSILEEKVYQQSCQIDQWVWIVGGKTEIHEVEVEEDRKCIKISFLGTNDLYLALSLAKVVVSRSGYSSLMDYQAIRISRLILIPTPGQTEQEYLAEMMSVNAHCITVSQDGLDLPLLLSNTSWKEENKVLLMHTDISNRLDSWLRGLEDDG